MQVYNKPIFPTLPLIMNTTLNSTPMPLWDTWGYSIQLVWTGTPTGTFKLQGSSDPILKGNPTSQNYNPVNWTDIANSPYAVTAAGNYMWNVFDVAYNYVRVVYTDGSSGAATSVITVATFNSKGV